MIETLLAIIAAEFGFIICVGVAIFGIEMYSLWLRFQAIKEEQGLTKIHVSPEEMKALLSGGGLPLSKMGTDKPVSEEAVKASGQYL